jgi:hypothetical protein
MSFFYTAADEVPARSNQLSIRRIFSWRLANNPRNTHHAAFSERSEACVFAHRRHSSRCRCKDPKQPRRHGPYYQLSYTWRGKSSSRFVRPEGVTEMRHKVEKYKRFRELVNEWVDLAVEQERTTSKQRYGD